MNSAGICDNLEEDIHFGNLIKELLEKEGRTIAWFAQQMNSDRSNMYKILSHVHIDSGFILRASWVLKHDFFKDASDRLRAMVAARQSSKTASLLKKSSHKESGKD
ncbi:MAG: hypothetical protein J6P65_05535 [Bacteroidales bacterium]|nr:hypothetical protein [Bacteroidales bacterium]